ncbi:hypothetical protein OAO74_00185 [Euryarchaeota archaeon]|nr:hypothetical protein [Euryarchaeota archaeon]
MEKVPLLEGEEIVSSVWCEPAPLFLTKKGWLAVANNHNIPTLSRLHRVLHVNRIKSLQLLVKTKNKLANILFLTMILCSMAYASYLFISNFGIESLVDSTTFVSTYDVEVYTVVDDIVLLWCFFPLSIFLVGSLLFKKNDKLTITFLSEDESESHFTVKTQSTDVTWTQNLLIIFSGFFYFIINWGGFQVLIHPYAIILGILLFFYLKREKIFTDLSISRKKIKNAADPGNEIIHDSISDFHSHLTIFLGIDDIETLQNVSMMSSRMPPEFNQLKKRVESHDSILSQIVVHYDHIFLSPTPWLSCSAVRSSTEKLLSFRVKKILPKAPKNKNLSDFRNLLNKHDTSLSGNILRDIDQISVLGNSAVHNMEASTSDYMSMLEKFVNVVDWHISNPPTSIVNDDE